MLPKPCVSESIRSTIFFFLSMPAGSVTADSLVLVLMSAPADAFLTVPKLQANNVYMPFAVKDMYPPALDGSASSNVYEALGI